MLTRQTLQHALGQVEVTIEPRIYEATAGELVSLIPLTPVARGIRTGGLYYPLRSEPLYIGPTRGISNHFTGEIATVAFEEGLRQTVRWYRDHADWLAHLRSGAYLRYDQPRRAKIKI